MVFSISRRRGAGRSLREIWLSEVASNWGKHCCCCWFGHKWSSNRLKNESRILNIHKIAVLWILKEDLGNGNLCVHFIQYSLTPEEREDRVTFCQDVIAMAEVDKNCLTESLRELIPVVFPVTPKQSDRFLNGLVRNPLRRRSWSYKGPASRLCWYFFLFSRCSAQKIRTRRKKSKCRIL